MYHVWLEKKRPKKGAEKGKGQRKGIGGRFVAVAAPSAKCALPPPHNSSNACGGSQGVKKRENRKK